MRLIDIIGSHEGVCAKMDSQEIVAAGAMESTS